MNYKRVGTINKIIAKGDFFNLPFFKPSYFNSCLTDYPSDCVLPIFDFNGEGVFLGVNDDGFEQVLIKYENCVSNYIIGSKGPGLMSFIPERTDFLNKLVNKYPNVSVFNELFKKKNIISVLENGLDLVFMNDYNEDLIPAGGLNAFLNA